MENPRDLLETILEIAEKSGGVRITKTEDDWWEVTVEFGYFEGDEIHGTEALAESFEDAVSEAYEAWYSWYSQMEDPPFTIDIDASGF